MNILGVVNWSVFARFKGVADGVATVPVPKKLRDEYEALKRSLTERLLHVLYANFPALDGHVIYTSLGTPLTMNRYVGAVRGEFSGLDHGHGRWSGRVQRLLRPQTPFKGLYLTGQDVTRQSLYGALVSPRCVCVCVRVCVCVCRARVLLSHRPEATPHPANKSANSYNSSPTCLLLGPGVINLHRFCRVAVRVDSNATVADSRRDQKPKPICARSVVAGSADSPAERRGYQVCVILAHNRIRCCSCNAPLSHRATGDARVCGAAQPAAHAPCTGTCDKEECFFAHFVLGAIWPPPEAAVGFGTGLGAMRVRVSARARACSARAYVHHMPVERCEPGR